MTHSNEEWRGIKKDVNRGGRFLIGWILIGVLLVLLVGAAIWAINVAASGPKGQADAFAEKNSSSNWVAAQAKFEDMYADIVQTDKKIDVAAEMLASNPTDKTFQQTLAGTKSYCLEVVGDYNAEARKYLAEEFRSADLPAQIDDYNTSTDCKENN